MDLRKARPGDTSIHGETFNFAVEKARLARVLAFDGQQFRVQDSGGVMRISLYPSTAGDFAWEDILFGYSISGTTVTIYAGEIHYGKLCVTTNDTDLTIATNPAYAHVRMAIGTRSAEIVVASAKTYSDDTYFYKWLYKFALVGSSVSRSGAGSIGHMGGAIDVPGIFGPST